MKAKPSNLLIIHGMDPRRWAARYGIEPFTVPCEGCGKPLTTSVPFVCGTLRGLLCNRCPCGAESTPYCIVRDPKHGDLFSGNDGSLLG